MLQYLILFGQVDYRLTMAGAIYILEIPTPPILLEIDKTNT